MTPLTPILVFLMATASVLAAVDNHESCKSWAEAGECDKNPGYMRENCLKSCDEFDTEAMKDDQDIAGIGSFYDFEANDIDGRVVKFDKFKGKAVVITNVASYCGYTESHYKSLVALHSEIRSTERVEILAFPCNQFGKQEPEECPVIKAFAKKKGAEFTMMYKIDVNGPDASPVYKWLKKVAGGPSSISWNFATYFVVQPDGLTVRSFSGVEPLELKGDILEMVEKEEL